MNLILQFKSMMEELELRGVRGWIMLPLCCACSLFFLYTAYFGAFHSTIQRSVLLLCCTFMVFLTKPSFKKYPRLGGVIDFIFITATIAGFGYTILQRDNLGIFIGLPRMTDFIFGIICIVCVVEATRRRVGLALPILSGIFLLYGAFGAFFPGIMQHSGMDADAFITALYMSEEGIFGVPVMAAANFIMAFVLFGAFLEVSGVGETFTNIAINLFGRMRGGPAKACVVSSALVGTMTGSAVANVVMTGPFTIPLMKKTGYSPSSAGAIEAVASTGGQIMPPVMGAAAFIMADTLGVPYWEILKAALVPACLFYVALFFMVDFEAAKGKLKGIALSDRTDVKKLILDSWYAILPILSIVFFLGYLRMSPQRSAFYTIVVIIIISMFRQHTRIGPLKFLKALIRGAKNGMEIGVVCGCAGIIISIILRSGLGISLTSLLIAVSGDSLLVLLLLTMVASIVLGMGLPTSAAYIITALLIAPAMVRMGIRPMSAHIFVFYFACLSAITPPVALASFAGASLSGASPMETCFKAVRFGLCGFIVPFMFVVGPPLVLVGTAPEIIIAIITACIGTYFLAVSLIGYHFTKVSMILRLPYAVCALILIYPGLATDIIGITGGIALSLINYWTSKKRMADLA